MQTRNKLLKHAFFLFFSLFSFDDKLVEFYSFANYKILKLSSLFYFCLVSTPKLGEFYTLQIIKFTV